MKAQIPKKVDGPDTVGLGYWPHQVNSMLLKELQQSYNQLIDFITAREELGDARHKELTSRIDTIEGNQQVQAQHIQNLRGGWTDVEIRKSAFSWPQIGDLIYCFNSRGDILEQRWNETDKQNGKRKFLGIFPTREAAEAYKAKLLADNAQV